MLSPLHCERIASRAYTKNSFVEEEIIFLRCGARYIHIDIYSDNKYTKIVISNPLNLKVQTHSQKALKRPPHFH